MTIRDIVWALLLATYLLSAIAAPLMVGRTRKPYTNVTAAWGAVWSLALFAAVWSLR